MQEEIKLVRREQAEIEAVRAHMGDLRPIEFKAILLRFWGAYSIAQIAAELRLSWRGADDVVDRALKRMRSSCFRDPLFTHRGMTLNLASRGSWLEVPSPESVFSSFAFVFRSGGENRSKEHCLLPKYRKEQHASD